MCKILKKKLLQLERSLYQDISESEASYCQGGNSLVYELGHAQGRINNSTPLLAKALVSN